MMDSGPSSSAQRLSFCWDSSGKERDAESGLDYFLARYYSGAQGRFTTPDIPLLSRLDNPQTWNLYSYTANNPLRRIDPNGRNWFNVGGNWTWYDGSDVDAKGNPCKRGSKGCTHSDYTHLLVFEKTGTNKYGAATGNLSLYHKGFGDRVAKSDAFSGGPNSPAKSDPLPNGEYMIQLLRAAIKSSRDLDPVTLGPKVNYGIQTIQDIREENFFSEVTWEWGDLRAMLNHPDNGDPSFQGNFLHGKNRPEDYTHGCICERSETVLRLLLQLIPHTTWVPVVVK